MKTKQQWLDYIEDDKTYPKRAIILDIYDDFGSRVCENCKYCKDDSNNESIWIECKNEQSEMFNSSLSTGKGYYEVIDFGCNKFEINQ